MNRIQKLSLAVFVLAFCFMSGVNAVHAATINVPADQATIAAAVAAASSGDTINVAAGTYTEHVTVTKSLTFTGANAGVAGSATRGAETIMDGTDGASQYGFLISAGNLDVTIDGFKFTDEMPVNEGTAHDASQTTDVTFTNNLVSSADAFQATDPDNNWRDVTVTNNKFLNIDTEADISSAIYLAYNRNSTITDNVIDTTEFGGIILIENTGTSTVSGNTISNTNQMGIQTAGVMGDTTINDNTITNGNVDNVTDGGGIFIYDTTFTGTISITGNTISDTTSKGIAVRDGGGSLAGKNIALRQNNLDGNDIGVYNGGTGSLDAAQNWWGDATGPHNTTSNPSGEGVEVSDNVSFDPWYINVGMTDSSHVSGGHHGGGGGGGSRTVTPAVPANTATPEGCAPGDMFSTTTGRNCNAATPAVVCNAGQIYSTTTGAKCTLTVTVGTPSTNPGKAYAFGTLMIKLGSKGAACSAWQMFLNDHMSAGLSVDGWCGKLTISAAKKWQASAGLSADGVLGPMSQAKANASL